MAAATATASTTIALPTITITLKDDLDVEAVVVSANEIAAEIISQSAAATATSSAVTTTSAVAAPKSKSSAAAKPFVPSDSPSAAAFLKTAGKLRQLCAYFRSGNCVYGDKCKWLHA